MEPRISSPVLTVPGVMDALQALSRRAAHTATQSGLPQATLDLVSVRASQINGCAVCLDMHTRAAKKAGETDERLATLALKGSRDATWIGLRSLLGRDWHLRPLGSDLYSGLPGVAVFLSLARE